MLLDLEGRLPERPEIKASVLRAILVEKMQSIHYHSAHLRLQVTSKAALVAATHLSSNANTTSTMQAPAIAPLLDG